jgi:hypothetical protein
MGVSRDLWISPSPARPSQSEILMHRSLPALLVVASLLVAACGSTTASGAPPASAAGPSAPNAATPAATDSAATTTAASASSASAAPESSAGAAGDGAALCAFLQGEIPKMQKASVGAGALSVLAIDYSDWVAADTSRVLPDAAAMDTLTEASCPSVRTNVLKLVGADSFANSF